jgi:hypothetical protein
VPPQHATCEGRNRQCLASISSLLSWHSWLCAGESSSELYILVRGDLSVVDKTNTPLARIGEATIFGEAPLLRSIEVSEAETMQ